MKIDSLQMAILSLLLLGFLYLYNTPTTVYKQKPVYYPVYENRYIPVNYNYDVFRPRPFYRRPHRPHRHHIHHDKPPINFTGGGIV
jgi:hypothetical protein